MDILQGLIFRSMMCADEEDEIITLNRIPSVNFYRGLRGFDNICFDESG